MIAEGEVRDRHTETKRQTRWKVPDRFTGLIAIGALLWGGFTYLLLFVDGPSSMFFKFAGRENPSQAVFVASFMALLSGLWIASGIGLLSGRAWGWWVASTQAVGGLLRWPGALWRYASSPFPGSLDEHLVMKVKVLGSLPMLVAVIIFLGLTLYLYSDRIRCWYGVQAIPRLRALVFSLLIVVVVREVLVTLAGSAALAPG